MDQLKIPTRDQLELVDFTVEDFCLSCPLQTVCDFDPGYGVKVSSKGDKTIVAVTNFQRHAESIMQPQLEIVHTRSWQLAAEEVPTWKVEESFDRCTSIGNYAKIPRKFMPGKIACRALCSLLPFDKPPKRKNLKELI